MKRIQRKRTKGWRMPENTVYVGRPSKWGNPFTLDKYSLEDSIWKYWHWLNEQVKKDPKFLEPLEGKDLACWCPIGQSCHADVLLKYIETQKVFFKSEKKRMLKAKTTRIYECGYRNKYANTCNHFSVRGTSPLCPYHMLKSICACKILFPEMFSNSQQTKAGS